MVATRSIGRVGALFETSRKRERDSPLPAVRRDRLQNIRSRDVRRRVPLPAIMHGIAGIPPQVLVNALAKPTTTGCHRLRASAVWLYGVGPGEASLESSWTWPPPSRLGSGAGGTEARLAEGLTGLLGPTGIQGFRWRRRLLGGGESTEEEPDGGGDGDDHGGHGESAGHGMTPLRCRMGIGSVGCRVVESRSAGERRARLLG